MSRLDASTDTKKFLKPGVFASGVPTSPMTSMLGECGSAHRFGSVVKYHCSPIPE